MRDLCLVAIRVARENTLLVDRGYHRCPQGHVAYGYQNFLGGLPLSLFNELSKSVIIFVC